MNSSYKSSSSSSSLGLLGEVSESINIQHTIQHVFTFRISDKWEKPLRRYTDKFLDLSLYYAESFRFIAVGIGSFFFLWGVSKVVAAGADNDRRGGSTSSSKSKSKSSRKGPSDNATVATQSSRTTTRTRRRLTAAVQSDEENPLPPSTIAFESITESDEQEDTNE